MSKQIDNIKQSSDFLFDDDYTFEKNDFTDEIRVNYISADSNLDDDPIDNFKIKWRDR